MSALIRAELLKLRTTRTFAGLVGAAVGISLLVAVLVSTLGSDFTQQDAKDLISIDASSLFILVLGAIGMTGEWRHRTIVSSFLAAPDRIRLLAAKLLAYGAAGILLSLIVSVAVAFVSTVILSARGEETAAVSDVLDILWRNLVLAGLFGALGVAVGSVVRVQVAAIVGLLVVFLIVEPAFNALKPEIGKFGPFLGVSNSLASDGLQGDAHDVLAPGFGILVGLAWIATFAALGAVLLRRRDLT